MSEDRVDLSHLAPPDSEVLVRAIEARTAGLLAERRARPTIIQLAVWWRPVAAAALLVAIASTIALTLEPRTVTSPLATAPNPVERRELAQALGVPSLLATSLSRESPPTAREFLRGVGGRR